MKPTIGRIVHYFIEGAVDPRPCAAIVVGVNAEGVDLHVFFPHGSEGHRRAVPGPGPNERAPGAAFWAWPERVEASVPRSAVVAPVASVTVQPIDGAAEPAS